MTNAAERAVAGAGPGRPPPAASAATRIHVEPGRGWLRTALGPATVHYVGDEEPGLAVARALTESAIGAGEIGRLLRSRNGSYAAIVETPQATVAFVDPCRGYPVFYAEAGGLALSNAARPLREGRDGLRVDGTALLELAMAGYVTGRETLFDGLRQLQAGELIRRDAATGTVRRERYYRFALETGSAPTEAALIEQLGAVTDRAVRRVIDFADGAPIWVPLSGGLDSRLIACKLKELGYDRVQTFSYGPAGNHEARIARTVADRLGLPWLFVRGSRAAARRFFAGAIRRDYWAFADGLAAVPNPQDLEPLVALREDGRLPDDAVLVNGQTGDFISGDHVPRALRSAGATEQDLIAGILDKHYSFWKPLKTPENLARIAAKIRAVLGLDGDAPSSQAELVAAYQRWEWQERQAKYVVNGQRIYDFLGLRWRLPFWDRELMDFWRTVPPQLLFGQALYRRYLERYDHAGLFKVFRPYVWRWPGASIAVVPVARGAGLLLGPAAKERVYDVARYFGHYRNHYAPYPFGYVRRNAHLARGALSFHAMTWLEENGLASELPWCPR